MNDFLRLKWFKGNKLIRRIGLSEAAPIFLLILGMAGYIYFYTFLCWLRHAALFNYEYIDMAEIIQLSWNTSKGSFFYQSLNPNAYGAFALHFEPAILFLSLFFVLFDHPISIYTGFNFALALGALFVYLISEKALKNRVISLLIAFAYLCYSPLKSMYLLSDPDPILLVVPASLLFFYFLLDKKFIACLISLFFILACKEDAALTVIALGLYTLLSRRSLKWGLIFLFIGTAYLVIAVKVIQTSGIYNNEGLFSFLKYGSFAGNLEFMLFHPFAFAAHIIRSRHLVFLGDMLKPLFYLPLFSPEFYLSAIPLTEVFLSKRPIEIGRAYYAASMVPFLFVGLILLLKRIKEFPGVFSEKARSTLIFSVAAASLASCLYSNFGANILGYLRRDRVNDAGFLGAENIYDGRFYKMTTESRKAWGMIRLIPPGAAVMATADLCPALACRKKLLYFPYPYDYTSWMQDKQIDTERMKPFLNEVDYLIINHRYKGYGSGEYPFYSPDEQRRIIQYVINLGSWKLVAASKDLTLLKKK